MILTIPGPRGSISTTIHVHDIVRVETCALEFFGKKVFNLYIIVKAKTDENFHLFSYVNNERFKAAYSSLSSVLKQTSQQIDLITIEPVSSIEPSPERDVLQPAL